ncbi:glycosyltransferase family 2 protein [Pedobacter sp. GR22-6]|uniref:glycosyltransferase family 2 protein n=1 Tax=Pedobacter sp. GR22-6 TaxID=3127957 RepID=UPI00307E6A2E
MNFAPIVLFAYNRLDHTKQVINALANNVFAQDSEFHIYSDAARDAEAKPQVDEIRKYLASVSGFKKVHIHLREQNLGVDANVISGVTEIIEVYGKVIVLEDDLVTSPWFLKYMNEALEFYEQEEEVISIHGYVYPVTQPLKEVFFLKGADCWGWATWKRGWELFEPDGKQLLDAIEQRGLGAAFDFNNTYPYLQALREQAAGETTCWDIRWYAAAFLGEKLTLYPGRSLVKNIGLDGTGTHCGDSSSHDVVLAATPVPIETEILPDKTAYDAFADFFFQLSAADLPKKNILSKAFRQIKSSMRAAFRVLM